jgi:rod shape-determining protein MreD
MPRLDSFLLSRSARVGQSSDPLWGIIFSLLAASVLTVYPVPYGLVGWRPLFMLLVMLFWVLCQPVWCGMWFAFFMGLACDLMLDSALGQHAFSFVVIAFAARFVAQNRRVLTFLNLWILAAAASLLHLITMFILQKFSGLDLSLSHWSSLLPSILIWPAVVSLLKRWRT